MESCQEPKSMSKLQRELKAPWGGCHWPSGAGVDTHTHVGRRTALGTGQRSRQRALYTKPGPLKACNNQQKGGPGSPS